MAQVRFADDFFKKERDQAYADWQSAIWRELFQNAIDQNATRIDIHLTQLDGHVALDFQDNGPGMSREVLENVYFAIGATTKGGSDQIGGMGRARVLTCFAMKSYRIRSHGYLVLGQGGEYEVQDAEWMPGCWLSIAIDDATLEDLQDKLMAFLRESRIDARIWLNGELLTVRAPLNGRMIRNLTLDDGTVFGQVYVNKSNDSKRLIVRVNGVAMYTTRIGVKAQIVVELVPAVARKVLTANRDGMHYDYRWAVDEFIRELTINTVSALRPRFARRTTITSGYGLRTVVNPVKKTKSKIENLIEIIQANFTSEAPFLPDGSNNQDTYDEATLPPNDFTAWLGRTFGDIHIYDETEQSAVHKVVGQYLPDNWRLLTVSGRTFRKGGNIIKVLLMWHTAITYALEVSLEIFRKTDIQYGVGFVFADDRLAEHRNVTDGHVFVLNPVDRMGKLRFAVAKRASLKRLMAYAKHEVTHVEESWHGEDFSRLREMIDIAFDEAECLRRMKIALRQVPDLADFEQSIAA
jgi:hypothetical protein